MAYTKYLILLVIWAACAVFPAGRPWAHDVPNQTDIVAFVRPEGNTLTVLVRAPMNALRDVDIPSRPDGFLDVAKLDPALAMASQIWISDLVTVYENGKKLPKPTLVAKRASLPSDRSFAEFESALANLKGPPLPEGTQIYWEQGLLDAAFEYPIESDRSEFGVEAGFTPLGLKVNLTLRFLPRDGPERAFNVPGDAGLVSLDPGWLQASLTFVREGFFHILGGIDHLLFLFCLVIPFRRFRPLVTVITAFTLAHSVTLIASAFGLAPDTLWFPPLIEMLIAASILYMAFENIIGPKLDRRWMVTFAFGLVHGFGFSFVLKEKLQFAGSHLLSSLLAFNVGVELGQLAVLAVIVPAVGLLFRFVMPERIGIIILSALVGHTAWHWMIERGQVLSQYPWPSFDAATVSNLLGWALALVVAAAAMWLVSGGVRRWQGAAPPSAKAEGTSATAAPPAE